MVIEELGTDLSLVPDLTFELVTGFDCLAEAIVRRLTTPSGALFYDPDYGLDVREWLNDAMTDEVLAELTQAITEQLEEDPRVTGVEVSVQRLAARTVLIGAALETLAGPFDLVMTVDDVKVDVLHASAA